MWNDGLAFFDKIYKLDIKDVIYVATVSKGIILLFSKNNSKLLILKLNQNIRTYNLRDEK